MGILHTIQAAKVVAEKQMTEKQAAEEINFPNQFTQLQEDWAERISNKAKEEAELEEEAKKRKLSPAVLKKLKEYRPL